MPEFPLLELDEELDEVLLLRLLELSLESLDELLSSESWGPSVCCFLLLLLVLFVLLLLPPLLLVAAVVVVLFV